MKLAYQALFIGILALIGIYSYSIANDMWKQSGTMSGIDMILGTLLVIMLLFFTWRVVGAAMPIIAILCILYALLGPRLPRGIAHRGYNWSRITELLFKGTNGIFGTPLGVSSIYVSVFVIFAGVLEASGAGDVFIRLTQSLLGGFRGGPAKVAVVASSLFGTISGSAVANVVLIMLLYPGKRRKFKDVMELIAGSSKGMVSVALTTGTAGIIVGILMLTGIGYKLSSLLITVSGGNVYLLLLLTMLTSVILGMGMPTSAAYVLFATLIVPALEELGVVKIAAHFFVFYFGIMANVTPPVAVAAYTAAGIAEGDSMKTGLVAWRLSLAGFLMPFMFCINPALLGQGSTLEIVMAIVTALTGSYGLATAVQRYFKGNLSWIKTLVVLAGSVCMMMPGTATDLIGIVCIGVVYGIQITNARRIQAA